MDLAGVKVSGSSVVGEEQIPKVKVSDRPRESCGIFGVYAPGEDVAKITFFGLYALQHRGQESAGISTADGNNLNLYTGMGLVSQVFTEDALEGLRGDIAIGHTRYSTTGSSRLYNAQPIKLSTPLGDMALAHNGNVVNAGYLREELCERGYSFSTATDSEVIGQLVASAPGKGWVEKIQYAMNRLQGAYSLVILTREGLIAVRDPLGVRPLCVGRLDGGWAIASESCALDHIGARFLREVEPGEILCADSHRLSSFQGGKEGKRAFCIFEYIYFARPDSICHKELIYPAREAMGAHLAREYPVDADLVIGIPDSATAAGLGYSRESGLPFREGLLKNRYVGRTFIQPDQRLREIGVQLKFNPLPGVLAGKRVVVVDDSIVRGTTTPRVINMLRKAGAREVHMRVCAPPIRHPCFFGVDMASSWELIAAQKEVPEIAQCIGADSLGYLSIQGLIESVGLPRELFCLACFTGDYPIPVQLALEKLALESRDGS
jgi:amidophosphoribosyltransferase